MAIINPPNPAPGSHPAIPAPVARAGNRPVEQWRLRPRFGTQAILILTTLMLFFIWSANRTKVYTLPTALARGVMDASNFQPHSEVGTSIRRMLSGFFPPDISEKTDLTRVPNFNPAHPPLFTHVIQEPIREYSAVTDTWKTVDVRPTLYDPVGYLKRVVILMLETIEIAIWGTLAALLLAIPVAFLSTRGYTPNQVTYTLGRGLCSWTRAFPSFISALIFVSIFGFGIIPAVIALGFSTMGFLGKFLADEIENADTGPQDALRSIGTTRLKILRYAVLPQVMPQYLAYLQYTLERNVQSATVIGAFGAGGIGLEMTGRWNMYDYGHVSTVILVIVCTGLLLERLTQLARKKLIA